MSLDTVPILRGVERLLFELVSLEHNGPHIVIVHRYRLRVYGARCQAGEEVSQVVLVHGAHQANIYLPLGPRLLFDHLARSKYIPQSAAQISSSMRLSPFYSQHGKNSGILSIRKIGPQSVKEYVKRVRMALGKAFEETGLQMDPKGILVSHPVSNEVRYNLKARVEWLHVSEIDTRSRSLRKVF
jgi:hypothetical protein